ncbi:MAG TPA: hypothetical protein DCF49_02650 [Lachnospiraceae bacterium]|nr:hypothetical protein [Lachnospiraceae bacterium]
MIRVTIQKEKGAYKSFICTGHAEYASNRGLRGLLNPQGDVVCAGVSAIVINTVNCLEDLLHEDIGYDYDDKEGGLLTCVFRSAPTNEASLLIDSMIHGLKWIRKEYGERYLKFEIEEV